MNNGTNGTSGYSWHVLGDPGEPSENDPARPKPTPKECGTIFNPDDAGRRRRLDCRLYDRCLDVAVDEKWDSFSCKGCPAYDPKTPMELRKEAKDMFAIFDRGEK